VFKRLTKTSAVCLAVLIATLPISNSAHANKFSNFYLKAGVGGIKHRKFKETDVFIKKAPGGTLAYMAGAGYKFNRSLRTDLTIQYAQLTYKGNQFRQGMHTRAAFINGYFDINLHEKITPYLTAGVGIGNNRAGDINGSTNSGMQVAQKGKSKTNFVWNVGTGAQYNINKNYAIDIEYRYMYLGSIHVQETSSITIPIDATNQRIRGHQIMSSLIYNL
jgi:opacity protein-like surface antigen